MKTIIATNDTTKFAMVDDDVFETIKEMKLKFCIQKNEYFVSTTRIQFHGMIKKKYLLLHRFVWILKVNEEPSSTVDHEDLDKSNNQISNLRLATSQEQQQHRGKLRTNTSGFSGICYYHKVNKYKNKTYEYDYWVAQIQKPNGKCEQKYFPYTDEGKIEAAKWYDFIALEYFGEFAVLNFPNDHKKTK